MKSILLTTTSLVLIGGVAAAETSLSWSGAATAGIARDGKVAAVASQITAEGVLDLIADFTAATKQSPASLTINTAPAITTAAALRTNITSAKSVINGTSTSGTLVSDAEALSELDAIVAILDAGDSTAVAIKATDDFTSYSEVNATVTGAVALDNGMSLSASVSVDAGDGYDFADDDGFDVVVAPKTNGVSLDSITLNAGAMGTFTVDQNAVAHLVDGDDDAKADLLYANTFGSVSFSAAVDLATDTDVTAVKAVAAVILTSATTGGTTGETRISTNAVTAVAADVQWSAKVSMPVAGGSAYVAMDEEGGNVFGASTTVGGIGLSFTSSLEALQEEISADRSNTIALSYVMGTVTAGASWNSVEDGDQWGISASYAGADGLSISASTDEGSDWSVSGAVSLGQGASVVGGVNYTEDAYLGLSFAF